MRRSTLLALALIPVAPALCFAQRPYVQLGGGIGLGTEWSSERGPFAAGAFALGLQGRGVTLRLDTRAFDTPAEPLLALGVAVGITSRPPQPATPVSLGRRWLGSFRGRRRSRQPPRGGPRPRRRASSGSLCRATV